MILDARITASSYWGFGGPNPYYAYYGRLNESRGRGGWCPKTSISEYLQIDMGRDRCVCGVATQETKEKQLTSSYKIRFFSSDGATWKTYKENKSEKVNIVQDKK